MLHIATCNQNPTHFNETQSSLMFQCSVYDESTLLPLINTTSYEVINGVISNATLDIFLWVITLILGTVAVFGTVTNIMNIICFVKQGFKDPVNVSFLGLAISDLGSVLTLIWTSISYIPPFKDSDLPFESIEYQYLTGSVPHTTFIRVTAWITAIITLERCLCITMPLKVKNIVTSKRLSILIAIVFFILIASIAPMYVVNRLGLKFYPEKNRTLIGLLFTADRENVESVSFIINNSLIPFCAFVVISVCTAILVIHLNKTTKWRMKSASSTQADPASLRNQRVAKMVVMISAIFIACFVPISLLFLTMTMVPGLSVTGENKNILVVIAGIVFVLESINSSVNIFVYFSMSTKFREVCLQLFKTG